MQDSATTGCPGHSAEPAIGSADEAARAVSTRPGPTEEPKTGILLVNHGSKSPTWRNLLLDVHRETAAELLANPTVGEVRTAFMEYTEPSIASQLRLFDDAGYERVLVIPLLLTISDHSFDDIPAICGRSEDPAKLSELEAEGIEVYPAKAALDFAPLMDFSGLVQRNVARRVRAITGRRPEDGSDARFGLVMVATEAPTSRMTGTGSSPSSATTSTSNSGSPTPNMPGAAIWSTTAGNRPSRRSRPCSRTWTG